MPTGYTDSLDKDNKTAERWFKEDLIRAFGVCVSLRDDNDTVSEKEIDEKLRFNMEKAGSHHRKELAKATKELNTLLNTTTDGGLKMMNDENTLIKASNEKNIKEAKIMFNRHEKVRKDLLNIVQKTKSVDVANIANFGINQLKLVENETKPYTNTLYTTLDEYMNKKLSHARWSVDYHTKELKEAVEHENERYRTYLEIKKEVNRLFKK